MKKKFFALMFVWAAVLSGVATAQTGRNTAQSNNLVSALPASDGAMTVNVRRLLSEALPQTLSGNQTMLTDVLGAIDRLKEKTGVDLRQFETVAVGVTSRKNAAGKLDFEPVVLARGSYNAASFVTLAKIAANSKYREEKIGGRTVYIFSPKQLVKESPKVAGASAKIPSFVKRTFGGMFDNLSNEIAVTAFDNNTLAVGTLARVRETVGANARLSGEVLDLLNRKPNSVMNFSLSLPGGLSNFVKLGNDEIGKNLDAVRFMAGAVDVSNGDALLSVTARTAAPAQAKNLQELLVALKTVGKSLIGNTRINGKEVFARLIEKAQIESSDRDVTLDVTVSQSDIGVLLDKFVKPTPVPVVSSK